MSRAAAVRGTWRLQHKNRRRIGLLAISTVLALVLSGCTNDPLADQYRGGSAKGYVAGDGRITEFAPSDRGPAVEFTGMTEDGSTVTNRNFKGKILVVNFWYAACPPCRAEARDLETVHQEFLSQGVEFLGVNVRDQVATSLAFERTFGITYPSAIDANSGSVQFAFSRVVAPNAVPTTLVLDGTGRVTSRILGRIPDKSVLRSLISSALREATTGG